MYHPNNRSSIEKYSSAVTLSDMEIFIFPELMYALVLANIMSPLLWEWKQDPWFKSLPKLSEYRRILRIKQFIMEKFKFNLDLETWGLTTKEKEIARFSDFVDIDILSRSNALFGYEGDKYYFDIDIRRHFGLDKFTSNTIPYWKTETIEAMDAFKYMDNHEVGAGECVSLAALYAAAFFVIGDIPLDKMYLLATPLHSQNFIDVKEGLITNNRRIVTKNMWFNGSELSVRSRRALQNEQVTIVTHHSGYIHSVFEKATINPESYKHFSQTIKDFLKTPLTFEVFIGFLRQNKSLQKKFQYIHHEKYILMETIFQNENEHHISFDKQNKEALLDKIDHQNFFDKPFKACLVNDMEAFLKHHHIDVEKEKDIKKLKEHCFAKNCQCADCLINDLIRFCKIEPYLPSTDKKWETEESIVLDKFNNREEIIDYLNSIRAHNTLADLAFMAFRDLSKSPWKPFLKAAIERNPVCIEETKELDINGIIERLNEMPNESIYDSCRLAQPDEVWNFGRGDGLEKAITVISILKNRDPKTLCSLEKTEGNIIVKTENRQYPFVTQKDVPLPSQNDWKEYIPIQR